MAFTYHALTIDNSGLVSHFQAEAWLVAVSGGLDSMVLLHALVQLSRSRPCPPIRVVHVNHGLHADAKAWQRQVEQQAQSYGLTCITQPVVVDASLKQERGLEAAARDARYQFFEQQLGLGEVLLLAQHADDQSETLLLRLMRGAGVAGLRAMPRQRDLGEGCLVRPLLQVRQHALVAYAQLHDLVWCEDPSNQDAGFDRNFLRHQIMPLLRQRWPSMDRRWATTAAVMDDTSQLLAEVAEVDFLALVEGLEGSMRLPTGKLLGLSRPRRHNVLRYWFALHKLPALSYGSMQRVDDELLTSASDAQPCMVLGNWCLRRSDNLLWLTAYTAQDAALVPEPWGGRVTQADLDHGVIRLSVGQLYRGSDYLVAISLAPGDQLEVRARAGAERCKPIGRAHSQSLKKLLQEAKVPAWERYQLPLFYVNGELAMVADLWVNAGFEAAFGEPAWGWQKPS